MPSDQKAGLIFISYSHHDHHHLESLKSHLAPLESSGKVILWDDGRIEPGTRWETAIFEHLNNSHITILLVTSHFFSSIFCVKRELLRAREREKEGVCDLVPVLVEPCDYGAHDWIGTLQLLPGGRPVTKFRPTSEGWAKVAEGIRKKIENLKANRPVSLTMDCREETVHSGQIPLKDEKRRGFQEFENVSAFWRAQPQLKRMELATVQATLSRFAPLVMGPPSAKRGIHKGFRQAIETNRGFGRRKSLTIDACMSVSAGQMVVRETLDGKPKLLLGLYSSIVRNSIPVFVKREYYEKVVKPLFKKSGGAESFEASVTGRVFRLDNNFMRRFLVRQGLTKILPKDKVDELCGNAFSLEVGDEGTGISERAEPTHYLDGDIWLAIRRPDDSERFLTSFVDITNKGEREKEFQILEELAASAETEVFGRYDRIPSIADFCGEG